jgi:phosphate transport system permease protein
MSSVVKSSQTLWRERKNFIFKAMVALFCSIAMLPLFFIFGFIFKQGISAISWDFVMTPAVSDTGIEGGIFNAIIGTVIIVGLAALISIPFGVLLGAFLSEYKHSKLAKFTGLAVEILHGIPSIVVGIVCWAWIVNTTGQFSALSGSLALGMMMLPVLIRSTEETLKLLPSSLKEGSLALGAPYWKTILLVVLPAGLSGIVNGVLLAIARVTGETAPLLFTALGSRFTNYSIFKEMEALPLLIYNYARDPDESFHTQAWGAAFVLLIMILGMNIFSKFLTRKWKWNG